MTESAPIIQFTGDPTHIRAGECATIRWHVEGVQAVYFYAEGERWQEHGVVGAGERQVCPAQTTTYCLRVLLRDDSVEVHKIAVQVQVPQETRAITLFSVDLDVIRAGECVTFRWHVEGVKAVYFYAEGEPWQEHGVAGVSEKQVCPSQTTTYCLRVVQRDDSVNARKITIQVQPQPEAMVTPLFAVDRRAIPAGECVTFRWHVEGVKAVYFFAEGEDWEEHGVAGVGQKQVCPPYTTTYCLRVVRRDDSQEMQSITVQVEG